MCVGVWVCWGGGGGGSVGLVDAPNVVPLATKTVLKFTGPEELAASFCALFNPPYLEAVALIGSYLQ